MTNFFDFAISRLPAVVADGRGPAPCEIEAMLQKEPFAAALRLLSGSFIALYEGSPEMTALFATRQNRLLCHALLALYFQKCGDCEAATGEAALTREDFGHLALRHGLASHNVAYAFFKEALKRGMTRPVDQSGNGPGTGVAPSAPALAMLTQWYDVHFQALDLLDEGFRASRFIRRSEALLPHIHRRVSQTFLSHPEVRCPGPLSIIFQLVRCGRPADGPPYRGRRLGKAARTGQASDRCGNSDTARGLPLPVAYPCRPQARRGRTDRRHRLERSARPFRALDFAGLLRGICPHAGPQSSHSR
ncbi:hypothetical protein L1887_57660 [Cichorium endivia]|nr:hypothetical protein L1887_57660 [Cichorium endivia]